MYRELVVPLIKHPVNVATSGLSGPDGQLFSLPIDAGAADAGDRFYRSDFVLSVLAAAAAFRKQLLKFAHAYSERRTWGVRGSCLRIGQRAPVARLDVLLSEIQFAHEQRSRPHNLTPTPRRTPNRTR